MLEHLRIKNSLQFMNRKKSKQIRNYINITDNKKHINPKPQKTMTITLRRILQSSFIIREETN